MAARSSTAEPPILTPDGRYIVHLGTAGPRLWRATRPDLATEDAARLRAELGRARSDVRTAKSDADRAAARRAVDSAKRMLGERGPVWWADGAADFSRRLVRNTPYAAWWAERGA